MLIGLALWQWGRPIFIFFRNQERIRLWLADFGWLAPLVSIGLNAAQVLLAPIPGQFIGLANGYLFGVIWGTLYSLAGLVLGSVLAMGLGRWVGRPLVQRLVSSQRLERWDALAIRHGPLFFFLIFLLPLVPDDIACFAVGLSPLSIPYILTLATVGRLPGLLVSSWIGAHATGLSPSGWIILGTGTAALAMLVLYYRDRIEAGLVEIAERWSHTFHRKT